jgi:signal peptidase I
MIVFHTGFTLHEIVSPSMSPVLTGDATGGDWVLAERVTRWVRGPRRFDVVAFRNSEGLTVMKRVAGLPGETVSVSGGRLLVGGQPVLGQPTHVTYLAYGNLAGGRRVECGEGYYLLGDDSRDSQDSRFDGPIPARSLRSRAWLRLWPLRRFGLVAG